jgi:hypothetical protein
MRVRFVVAALTLAFASPALAGGKNKCPQKPPPIYMDDELDVHENGDVHDDDGPEAKLSPDGLARVLAFRDSGAKPAKVKKCLVALSKNEKSKAAKRACKVKKNR